MKTPPSDPKTVDTLWNTSVKLIMREYQLFGGCPMTKAVCRSALESRQADLEGASCLSDRVMVSLPFLFVAAAESLNSSRQMNLQHLVVIPGVLASVVSMVLNKALDD